jgi:hypothetical protein
MSLQINTLKPFIGSKDFEISKLFYREMGFEEVAIDTNLSLFKNGTFGFYLQNYYLKEWLENTMLFVEVNNVEKTFNDLSEISLHSKFNGVKILPIKEEAWGRVFHVIDPSGILLHFAKMN